MHVLMMFQQKAEKVFQDIHDGLRHAKIKDCFLVNVDYQNQPFLIKALKCLSSFINKDFSPKPWNRSSHLESFIAPKKNESLSFKDHRFNRIVLPPFYRTLMISRTILNEINLFSMQYPSLIEDL